MTQEHNAESGRREYDDERPGMMRVHVFQGYADTLRAQYTTTGLRALARDKGVNLKGSSDKREIARLLVFAGVRPTVTTPGLGAGEEK